MYSEQRILSLFLIVCLDIALCDITDNVPSTINNKTKRSSYDTDINYPDLGSGDPYTFAVLLFIYFKGGIQKTCSGAIIQDHVVITAARCFYLNFKISTSADLELSMSFVVIGTRKQYLSGYENYIPMDKVLIHPNYDGIDSTPDLALVYTYMGLVTDKGGTAVPIVNRPWDKTFTVVTWSAPKQSTKDSFEDGRRSLKRFGKTKKFKSELDAPSIYMRQLGDKYKKEVIPFINNRRAAAMQHRLSTTNDTQEADALEDLLKSFRNNTRRVQEGFSIKTPEGKRSLFVHEFSLIKRSECEKKAKEEGKNITLTQHYCFSSYQDIMAKNDTGAPAISRGQLVSLTLGTLEPDVIKRYISYGVNLACYCPWIVENLLKPKSPLASRECCFECCESSPTNLDESDNNSMNTSSDDVTSPPNEELVTPENLAPAQNQPAQNQPAQNQPVQNQPANPLPDFNTPAEAVATKPTKLPEPEVEVTTLPPIINISTIPSTMPEDALIMEAYMKSN